MHVYIKNYVWNVILSLFLETVVFLVAFLVYYIDFFFFFFWLDLIDEEPFVFLFLFLIFSRERSFMLCRTPSSMRLISILFFRSWFFLKINALCYMNLFFFVIKQNELYADLYENKVFSNG